jgi:hypothetical protein
MSLVYGPESVYLGVVGYSFFCCCSSCSSNSSAFGVLTRGPVMPVLAGGSLAGKLSSSALSCWSLCLFILFSLYRHSNAPSHSPVAGRTVRQHYDTSRSCIMTGARLSTCASWATIQTRTYRQPADMSSLAPHFATG